jgi:NAD(P) transhydrogenase
MQAKHYDLVVIGAGPGGVWGARTAAGLGKCVALVEKTGMIGVAGINTGTIPSKTLRETALALSGWRSRRLFGVDLSLRRRATIGDFMYHEKNVTKQGSRLTKLCSLATAQGKRTHQTNYPQ